MKLFPRVSMGCISKRLSLLLIVLLAVSSLIMAKPAFAQTSTPTPQPIPTPSVPEFTVQLVGPSVTVPTTYSLNQSSGQVVANIGYIVEYSAVEVTVKNQPFTPYVDSSGNAVSVFYNIQILDDQSSAWSDLYSSTGGYPAQSTDSDYTNISIHVDTGQNDEGITIPVGTQTEIRVEAMIGYISANFVAYNPNPPYIADYTNYSFVGQTSSWSPTQTVTIPANTPLSPTPISSFSPTVTPTPAPNSTSTPNQTASASPKNPTSIYKILIATLVILIIAFAVVMAVFMRGRRR